VLEVPCYERQIKVVMTEVELLFNEK